MSLISIVNYASLQNARRLDAEFYQSHLTLVVDLLRTKRHTRLGKEMIIRSGTTPPDRDDSLRDGVVLLKTVNIQNCVLPIMGDYYRISPEIDERMAKTRLQENDVLINIVGAALDVIGRASIVPSGFEPANITQAMALLRPKPDSQITSEYLFCLLMSRYGVMQVRRTARPTGQYNLNLQELSGFIAPLLTDRFQSVIGLLVRNSIQQQAKSYKDYSEAKQLLLSELGLQNWTPTPALTYTRNYSQAARTRRMDAEYFHPKCDDLLATVKANARYCKRVKNIQVFNARGSQPEYLETGALRVINSRHILEQHLDYDNFEHTNLQYWDSQRESRVFKYDILVYTTGANVGRTSIYLEDTEALASNHVNILRVRDENPIYVGFVLNSIIGRLQTRKSITGTAQAELYPADLGQFLVPFIASNKQEQICTFVQESHTARREAKALLEKAKRAVEIAIEQDEDTALAFINQ